MAYRKKSWWEKYWRTMLNSLVSSALGAVVVATGITMQQKPFSQEIEASQNATYTAHAYSVEQFNNNTATGKKPRPGYDVAVSPDVAEKLLGKKVYLLEQDTGRSLGVREVTDMMSSSNTRSIDILVPTTEQAKKFGTKEVKVIVLER